MVRSTCSQVAPTGAGRTTSSPTVSHRFDSQAVVCSFHGAEQVTSNVLLANLGKRQGHCISRPSIRRRWHGRVCFGKLVWTISPTVTRSSTAHLPL